MSDPKIRLGGLWLHRSKHGTEYLSGRLGQARLLVFRNDRKRDDGQPDYVMYLAEDERSPTSTASRPGEPAAP